MKYERYAIRIKVPLWERGFDVLQDGYVKAHIREFWHCQGMPNDPRDFGMAVLYATRSAARRAIEKQTNGFMSIARCELVSVECEYSF